MYHQHADLLATAMWKQQAGWNLEVHEKYFTWIRIAFKYKGGRSYVGFD